MKDGLVIDSISIDITKKTILDTVSQNRDHVFDFWDDGSSRLIANPSIIKRAMRNRTTLLKAGWSYENAVFVLLSTVDDLDNDKHPSGNLVDFIGYIGNKNVGAGKQYYIISQAVEAYELFMEAFDAKKRLKMREKFPSGNCVESEVMYLAIFTALMNPCVDKQWESKYNRQGARSRHRPPNRLTEVFELLQEQKNELLHELSLIENEGEYGDPDEYEDLRGEITTVNSMLEILEVKIESKIIEENVQIDAIDAAKTLLAFSGIPCGTNTIEQEWAQFVATAWGVTPSQVVSAAKALKKRESQEQR